MQLFYAKMSDIKALNQMMPVWPYFELILSQGKYQQYELLESRALQTD